MIAVVYTIAVCASLALIACAHAYERGFKRGRKVTTPYDPEGRADLLAEFERGLEK